ncbi:CHAT domain-containing tetratricopeptide repeat protein [Gemmatirosa kalamazoonensis]|uniref:CHAT domain-containing tetratricopeptide repeat protein n=1 Tax=Gemmatirosa kalamazoonensis TaxID=861299 RepID=UPI00130E26F5|nr:tetratricopeptide repeat protein [Gemmatirosa kalamazoonensis]
MSSPSHAQTTADSATDLLDRGLRQTQSRQFDSAAVSLRAALRLKHAIADHGGEARVLNGIGLLHFSTHQPDSALIYFRAALLLARDGGDRRLEATTLTTIGLLYQTTGRPDSAFGYFREALPLSRASGDGRLEAMALVGVGGFYLRTSRPDSALGYLRAALPLVRALRDSGGELAMLNSIGMAHDSAGRRDSAVAYYRATLPLRRAMGDRAGEVATVSTIGTIYYRIGPADSALAYYRAALAYYRTAGNRRAEATTLGSIGLVYHGASAIDSALAYFRSALLIQRAVADRGGEATTLYDIGSIYLGTGQRDSALSYFRSVLPLAHAVNNRALEGEALNSVGSAYWGMRQLDSALSYHREALRLSREVRDRGTEASALGNIGTVYHRIGQFDSALTYYQMALPLQRDVGDRDGEASALANIGVLYWRTGRPDAALGDFRDALALRRAMGDPQGEAAALSWIGKLLDHAGQSDAARALLDSASARFATVRMRTGSDASAVAYAEDQRGAVDLWVRSWLTHARAASDGAVAAALAAAERGRAQGLRDLLARASTSAGPAVPNSADILWERDTVPGADLAAEAAKELAPLRHTRTAALYYFLGHDSYSSQDTLTTWLLDAAGKLRLAGLAVVKPDSLAALVTTLRTALGADAARTRMARGGQLEQERAASGTGAPDDAARSRGVEDESTPEGQARSRAATAALGALLLPDALTRAVPAGTDLVIVPHGVLALVPFAALPIAGDTLPLGARYALRYAPSLRVLDAAESRGVSRARSALVVGDPAMPRVVSADGRRVPLRDLPAARREGEVVAGRFGVAMLTGGAATETAVRQALPTAPVVHLATHGLAYGSEARVRDSYVALAPDSANDGLLTIGELLDDVPSLAADLVVLSACQTGLGDLKQAEGTVGFQRALLAKGARSVLVSLWSVDDRATALLMDRFYAHWLGSDGMPAMSKAEALRLAQSDVRLTPGFASPRYWAAFQLVGAR